MYYDWEVYGPSVYRRIHASKVGRLEGGEERDEYQQAGQQIVETSSSGYHSHSPTSTIATNTSTMITTYTTTDQSFCI